METPTTFSELFEFYNDFVRLLYGRIQAQNALPQETLFEINAAFDHISRHWTQKHSEADEVEKAFSHLKRSCLDIFKLTLKDAIDRYNELCQIDTSIIDNGKFDRDMHKLVSDMKAKSVKARQADAETHDGIEEAFALWAEVYRMCNVFDQEFFNNQHVEWARKKNLTYTRKTFLLSIGASLVAGMMLGLPLEKVLSKIMLVFAQ